MQTENFSTLTTCGLKYVFEYLICNRNVCNLLSPVMSLALPHIYTGVYKLKNRLKQKLHFVPTDLGQVERKNSIV